jgi:hypothetical protein
MGECCIAPLFLASALYGGKWSPSRPGRFILGTLRRRRTRGSVVGWETMLQAGMLRIRIPMRSPIFFPPPNLTNLSSRTIALRSTQPLREMSTRNLPGGWGWGDRPMRKADNLTAICEPIVQKMWEPSRLTTLYASTTCYMACFLFKNIRPSLLDTVQSSWLQIRRSGFDSRATKFSVKQWVWNWVHSASWVQVRGYMKEKVADPV